jgi:hypothetical protein
VKNVKAVGNGHLWHSCYSYSTNVETRALQGGTYKAILPASRISFSGRRPLLFGSIGASGEGSKVAVSVTLCAAVQQLRGEHALLEPELSGPGVYGVYDEAGTLQVSV